MSEAHISTDIRKLIKALGGSVYSTEQGYRKERGGTRTTAGIPDIIVFFPEAWTFAELKTPKGRMSPAQEGFRLVCEESGAPWVCWRDVRDCWDWCASHGIVEEAA